MTPTQDTIKNHKKNLKKPLKTLKRLKSPANNQQITLKKVKNRSGAVV
jgi:hypothetical protein